MDDREFARVLLGVVQCGNKTICLNDDLAKSLERILSSWILYSESRPSVLDKLSSLYPNLTPVERMILRSIIGKEQVSFETLRSEVWEGDISDERVVQALNMLRKKLPKGWRYSVSRSNYELVWTSKPTS